MRTKTRVRIGDVVEIPTKRGLAYAQYTHKVPQWGALLRVLPGFHAARPSDFSAVVQEKENFLQLFPLQAAVNEAIFSIVANCAVPASAQVFPLFRAAGWRTKEGKVTDWWLWDGTKSWRIGKLTDEQRKLPLQNVCNDTALIERIEEEWTPETDISSQE